MSLARVIRFGSAANVLSDDASEDSLSGRAEEGAAICQTLGRERSGRWVNVVAGRERMGSSSS